MRGGCVFGRHCEGTRFNAERNVHNIKEKKGSCQRAASCVYAADDCIQHHSVGKVDYCNLLIQISPVIEILSTSLQKENVNLTSIHFCYFNCRCINEHIICMLIHHYYRYCIHTQPGLVSHQNCYVYFYTCMNTSYTSLLPISKIVCTCMQSLSRMC